MRFHSGLFAAALVVLLGVGVSARGDTVIDGVNNFAPGDTYSTSDSNYTGHFAFNGSAFHFGMTGADIQSGGSQHFLVAYLGIPGTGSTTGINFNTQQPNLPFIATHAFVYRADGGYTQFFDYSTSAWTPIASTGSVAESGTFFEASLPWVDFNYVMTTPPGFNFLAYMLFEGSGFESSYAVMPSDSFANGSYDPNPSTHFNRVVPEPATLGLLASAGLLAMRRR
jgi:hypothetical protein